MNTPIATLPPSVRTTLEEARARLSEMYGDRLARVVLYGSQARGEATPESDVDVLVVLRETFDLYEEIKRLTRIQIELLDRHGLLVSLQPYSEDEFVHRQSSFLINVRADGVEL